MGNLEMSFILWKENITLNLVNVARWEGGAISQVVGPASLGTFVNVSD
jgi:hypothetical protein